ncbi:unnamed protein product [Trichobilharzia regenti]|nr:unnamed protein product [Trichobilharzia regenti]
MSAQKSTHHIPDTHAAPTILDKPSIDSNGKNATKKRSTRGRKPAAQVAQEPVDEASSTPLNSRQINPPAISEEDADEWCNVVSRKKRDKDNTSVTSPTKERKTRLRARKPRQANLIPLTGRSSSTKWKRHWSPIPRPDSSMTLTWLSPFKTSYCHKQYQDWGFSGCPSSQFNDSETSVGRPRKHQTELRVCYTNARKLLNKPTELANMIDSGNPDVIIITETWLTANVTDIEVNLPNFEVHRVDRLNRKGGGVVSYLKKCLTVRNVEALAHESESCELIRCRLKRIGQDIDLIAVYRSPDCSADDFLIEKLGSWTSKCRSLVVIQHIIKPTHYDSQHSSSTLDLVFSHNEDVDLIQHLPPLGRSDHVQVHSNGSKGQNPSSTKSLETQHGFRRNLSCPSNLLTARESWIKSRHNRRPVDVVFIDFSKTFDKVSHKRLLMKLESLGIKGNLLSWLREFLIDKRQRVRINWKLSSWTAVRSGVPQGTVLGPLLFILYIDELSLLTSSPMILYADDLKIWRELKGNSDTFTLQEDLNKLSEWTKEWMLSITVAKCATMRIGQAGTSSYELEGITFPSVQTHLNLGVIVSHDLKTTAHCRAVAVRSIRSL